MELEKTFEKMLQRISVITAMTTKKIVSKELKKFKKDIIKGVLKNAAGNK